MTNLTELEFRLAALEVVAREGRRDARMLLEGHEAAMRQMDAFDQRLMALELAVESGGRVTRQCLTQAEEQFSEIKSELNRQVSEIRGHLDKRFGSFEEKLGALPHSIAELLREEHPEEQQKEQQQERHKD